MTAGLADTITTEQTAPPAATPDARQVLADVVWLMMSAPSHKHLFLADLEWLVVPPVMAGQYRVFKRDGVPVAYASWGFLTEEAEERLIAGDTRLKPADWSAGDKAWLIDLTAPFGGMDDIAQTLKAQVFPETEVKMLKPSVTGVGVEVRVLEETL